MHGRDFICVLRYQVPPLSSFLHLQMGQVGLGELPSGSLHDSDKAKANPFQLLQSCDWCKV
jgi:hypothetical protein